MQKTTSLRHTHGDNPDHKQELLDALAGELPPFIARADVERHLGGMVSGKTLSNADARGDGPEVAYAVGFPQFFRAAPCRFQGELSL